MDEFRCPFEKKGEEEGTILTVDLCEERTTNRERVIKKLKAFHTTQRWVAIRCRLPPSAHEGCCSLTELLPRILPYQIDILTAEIEYRLKPYLPYQLHSSPRKGFKRSGNDPRFRALYAQSLVAAMMESGAGLPRASADLAHWLERMLSRGPGAKPAGIQLFENESGFPMPTFCIRLGGLDFMIDRARSVDDGKVNWNCFNIVKAPFYPPSFGRWSPSVEVVLTREADINALSKETRRRVRTQANAVHQAHGIEIKNLADDKQETGLWIPKKQ